MLISRRRLVPMDFLLCLGALATTAFPTLSSGQVNSWINPSNGSWDQPSNWSLGILPNSSQSVMLTNSGWKAVAINPSTPINFPGSMTVSNLTIRGAWDTYNTLILNFFGTGVPLTIRNGLTVAENAQIVNLNSALIVQSGTITITNAQIVQDGGFIRATNSSMLLLKSVYHMTNGVFEGGTVLAGTPFPALPGSFIQYGGTVRISDLALNYHYSLYDGTLDLPGGLNLFGRASGTSYFQAGGTNRSSHLMMQDGYAGSGPNLTLNGGLLAVGDADIYSGWYGVSTLTQNGGTHFVTNALYIAGGATTGATPKPAYYYLNDGTLSAHSMELNANQGDTVFAQVNGTTRAETIYAHSVGWFGSFVVNMIMSGGSLSCSNFTLDDGRGILSQTGGALVVSNLLTITGYRDLNIRYYGRYTFTGGTVTASNINIDGEWIIGDGSPNRISNSGTVSLSHLLQIGNASEQLGRFILASNATINLAGSSSRLNFANSSAESWPGGATLMVVNWNGNPSGGGAEQLKFGTSQSGLTPAQLSQIHFLIGTNSYSAKVLNTGEVVPDHLTEPSIAFSKQGNNLMLTWPAGWTLQSSTDVLGPYEDVPEANAPYTVDTLENPQQFFRLRQ